MFALIAVILFCLKAFGVAWEEVDILALGLAFLALGVLVGNWPLGYIQIGRRQ